MTFGSLHVKNQELIFKVICYCVALLTLAIVWLPLASHYYVPSAKIPDDIIEQAREIPSDVVIEGLVPFFSTVRSWETQKLLDVAEKLLVGQVEIPQHPRTTITLPFDERDFGKGLPGWQLRMAGLGIPEILLEAYQRTNRDEFLLLASEMIAGFGRHESGVWIPSGYVWNDHAISTRVLVLANFWRLYRNHPSFDIETATTLFEMVSRCAALLSKPSHFTVTSNHGIMQNLALWEICLAFPTLDKIEEYRSLALERMQAQMQFYINEEGVVLEHSMSYHIAGIRFLGLAIRYLTMLKTPVPEAWKEKYQKAIEFYTHMSRPDLSLPVFGDTGHQKYDPPIPVESFPEAGGTHDTDVLVTNANRRRKLIYPVAGYAFWWDEQQVGSSPSRSSQTAFAWSNFVGHGHKHADEMSMELWAHEQRWWTNVGNWKYGTQGRADSISWMASNAPHWVGENVRSSRKTALKYRGNSQRLAAIDLERKATKDYTARRQVIHLKPNIWLVFDHSRTSTKHQSETVWTTSYDITVKENDTPGSFTLRSDKSESTMTTFFMGAQGMNVSQYRGSYDPFAGWNVLKTESIPTTAFVIRQPADNGWSAAVWSLESLGASTESDFGPPTIRWGGPDNWDIDIPTSKTVITAWRKANTVYVDRGQGSGTEILSLEQQADVSDQYHAIRDGFRKAVAKYPKYQSRTSYRWRMTYYTFCAFLMQEIFFIGYRKFGGQHYAGWRILAVFGWAGVIGMWLKLMVSLG